MDDFDPDKTLDQSDFGDKRETRELKEPSSNHRQIGPYRLLEKIGQGGMGTVWLADQSEPIRRRVALKLIRSGIEAQEVVARFEAERQAMAMMSHQNIATILDAGTSEKGEPYFVMEFVPGIPITEYCDQNKLDVRQRLMLMTSICSAIEHAHQKGIVHRDIKPSNILVADVDGVPTPKVIDFGLAKALNRSTVLTDKTLFTEFGKVVGTVQYMSPEQADSDVTGIDKRTDVYSLGVVTYELLTGSTPLTANELRQNALLNVLKIIKESDPEVPSHRISSSQNTLSEICEARNMGPVDLRKLLRVELDWVVMKALQKNRMERYDSAGEFGADITRYLNGSPTLAKPPSIIHTSSKRFWKSIADKPLAWLFGGLVLMVIQFVVMSFIKNQLPDYYPDVVEFRKFIWKVLLIGATIGLVVGALQGWIGKVDVQKTSLSCALILALLFSLVGVGVSVAWPGVREWANEALDYISGDADIGSGGAGASD